MRQFVYCLLASAVWIAAAALATAADTFGDLEQPESVQSGRSQQGFAETGYTADHRRASSGLISQPAAASAQAGYADRVPVAMRQATYHQQAEATGQYGGEPIPAYTSGVTGATPVRYDAPHMPNYAWPSYAPYPNYGAVTYPQQYSPTAWPYIGPFYPYPQVPLGWRKVTLEWDDGWWMLDFKQR